MAEALRRPVLSEVFGAHEGRALLIKQVLLVIGGVAAMWAAAKIKIPMDPVPVTMQTFVMLSVGAAYGARLGLITIFAYLALGALGLDVFTNSSAEANGLAYMMANTGGYLVGFALAIAALGQFARLGWDRSVPLMALAMLVGNILIYVPGVAWLAYLNVEAQGWDWVWYWGFGYFAVTDGDRKSVV